MVFVLACTVAVAVLASPRASAFKPALPENHVSVARDLDSMTRVLREQLPQQDVGGKQDEVQHFHDEDEPLVQEEVTSAESSSEASEAGLSNNKLSTTHDKESETPSLNEPQQTGQGTQAENGHEPQPLVPEETADMQVGAKRNPHQYALDLANRVDATMEPEPMLILKGVPHASHWRYQRQDITVRNEESHVGGSKRNYTRRAPTSSRIPGSTSLTGATRAFHHTRQKSTGPKDVMSAHARAQAVRNRGKRNDNQNVARNLHPEHGRGTWAHGTSNSSFLSLPAHEQGASRSLKSFTAPPPTSFLEITCETCTFELVPTEPFPGYYAYYLSRSSGMFVGAGREAARHADLALNSLLIRSL
eukprot:scaffold106_cov380-Prasinococcus_capsulatus_cf.AAC.30